MFQGILIISMFMFGIVYSESCSLFHVKEEYLNTWLVGHSLLETTAVNHQECARECMSLSVCKSIDYYRQDNVCKLNDEESFSVNINEFSIVNGAIFSDISDWPSALARSCSSRPCAPYQRCISNGESHLCRDITCATNQLIDHGQIQVSTSARNKFLDTATVECNFGYIPSRNVTKCQARGQWEPVTCIRHYESDCKEILDKFPSVMSGVYEIKLWSSREIVNVYCDMETEGGGWTVFQRRFDGSVDFYRNFSEYENGFGTTEGEFWLGLRNIQEIAFQGSTELRIDMSKANGEEAYELFQNFSLDGDSYVLNIGARSGNTSGNAAQGLQYHEGRSFTTFDRDKDTKPDGNCAVARHGAWWYGYCGYVNLNGFYSIPGTVCTVSETGSCGLVHAEFTGQQSLKTSIMMIRRK